MIYQTISPILFIALLFAVASLGFFCGYAWKGSDYRKRRKARREAIRAAARSLAR